MSHNTDNQQEPTVEELQSLINLYTKGQHKETLMKASRLLSMFPDSVNLNVIKGAVLKQLGNLEEAVNAYRTAISIKPNNAEAYYNMGNALREQGKLKEAIAVYSKAISIKPNLAEAYYNMGTAFRDQSNLSEAIEAYLNALSIQPDFTEVYWNLSGSCENIQEANKWLGKCLESDPNYLNAKLFRSALKYYDGDHTEFQMLTRSSLKDHPYVRSFAWVFGLPKLPKLHFHRWALFDQMIALSEKDRPFYEFGVWRGEAFKYLIETFKIGYGFDTFEGLPEVWRDQKKGTYSSDGNVPNIEGGEFISGKFEDTLPSFFARNRPKASIINFDADLYSSTICALDHCRSVIDKNTVLIFDEFLMNKSWEQDEYRALEEFCLKNHFSYEVLAVSFFTKQVAVRVVGS